MYRILVQHMDEFKKQVKSVPSHMPSRYSKEIAPKSRVVSTKVQKIVVPSYVYRNEVLIV